MYVGHQPETEGRRGASDGGRTSDVKKTRALDGDGSDETVIVSDLFAGVELTISSNVYVA